MTGFNSKLLVSALGLMMFLALMLAGATGPQQSRDSNTSGAATSQFPTSPATERITDVSNRVITDTTDVPIYPGAQELSSSEKDGPFSRLYLFTTTAPLENVISYYKQELMNAGWVITSEGRFENRFSMELVWRNTTDEIPIRRFLRMGITSSATDNQTSISMYLARWPDPTKLPIYSSAEQLNVTWSWEQEGGYFRQRVIRFETAARADEVEAYYKDVLIQHGWWFTNSTRARLVFTYTHLMSPAKGQNDPTLLAVQDGRRPGTGSMVLVNVSSPQGDKTKVELRVSGDEIDLLYQQENK